jgi:acetyl esterase
VLQQLKGSAIRAAISRDWIVKLASRGRAADIANGLDPQVAAVLEYERLMKLPRLESMDPVRARAYSESNLGPADLDHQSMANVTDTTVGEQRTPVRIFEPHGENGDWLVWFHGGGGVIGSISGSEAICRYIAAKTRTTVASVGYRLGPEDKHPAAIDDACAAWESLLDRAPGRVAVGGDSFGGFLAAHVDHWTRAAGVRPPDLQVLVYPIVDLRLASPSIDKFAEGFLLTKPMMQYFRGHYLNDSDDPEAASPYFWSDVAGSAPAIVATAGFDPLVDEGDGWAERLEAAGVTVRHLRFDSLVHGFLSLAGIVRTAHAAVDTICQEIVDSASW